MRIFTLATPLLLALVGAVHAHTDSCATALRAAEPVPARPLPAACASIGPLRVGMTHAQVIQALGSPDKDATNSGPYSTAVYVFPRDLADRLANAPVKASELHHTDLYVIFRGGNVAAISIVADPAVPLDYTIGDLALDGPADALFQRIGVKPAWNASKDTATLYPYPIDFEVDPDTHQIVGATVAADDQARSGGRRARFELVKDPATGLVRGYRVVIDPSGH